MFFTVGLCWFHVFIVFTCFMVESRGPGPNAAAIARLLPPTPVTRCWMTSKCLSSQCSIFLFLFVFSRDATFTTCEPFSFGAGVGRHRGSRTKKCPFYPPQFNVSFRTYWYLLANIPIIFTIIRTIFTDNCYGAPWENVAVLSGLLDGVR